ncbi:MAG: STM4011 family radical SAM protein [Planctomycetaceae bacterium]|nr:STM4011 family radical SAM protein [Planctomycetaceae bacterium]
MTRHVSLLYRGPLSSCNYDCSYCPFAKRHETAAQLQQDRAALERFVDWATAHRESQLSLFFTPWGEALTRRWYQTAVQQLTHRAHIRKIVVQTNLSWATPWLNECRTERLALWCTYHPSEVSRHAFLAACRELRRRGIRHSVGMVARPEDFAEIESLRRLLPASTYLWLNAWDTGDGRKYEYSPQQRDRLTAVDPYFEINTRDYPSAGQDCQTGRSVFSINGDGRVRRCHFVSEDLGNLYAEDWRFPVDSAACPNSTCGCHIGYVHLPVLNLQPVFGSGVLERIPLAYSDHLPASADFQVSGKTYG